MGARREGREYDDVCTRPYLKGYGAEVDMSVGIGSESKVWEEVAVGIGVSVEAGIESELESEIGRAGSG